MDECTDMAIGEAHSKNAAFHHSPPHFGATLDLNFNHKNPFDRQFELARKNNINPLRYAPSIANLSQTSPLNTPSISLNDGAYISANVQGLDLIGPSPLIPPTPLTLPLAESAKPTEESATPKTNNRLVSQRSNTVSVICPPVPTSKVTDTPCDSPLVKSAPTIIEPSLGSAIKGPADRLLPKPVPKSADEILYSQNKRLKPLTETRFPESPPRQEASLPLPIQGKSSLSSLAGNGEPTIEHAKENHSSLIKIVPKPTPATRNSADKLLKISSLPPSKKKEKSEEELLIKLKATEAALPPKAKPGRKSRSATAEDSKEKKKRSLERNRAAAMRCRLKKKKEVDELKTKVEKYEQQNKELRRIIEGLYAEVRELKGQLLKHKDC